jgi:hypothetical protein
MCCLTLYLVVLFVLLTPGILVRLPKNGGKWTVALVHGAILAVVAFFTCGPVKRLLGGLGLEGFDAPTVKPTEKPTEKPASEPAKGPTVASTANKVLDSVMSGHDAFAGAVKSSPATYA